MNTNKNQHTNPTNSIRKTGDTIDRQHFLEIRDHDKLLDTCIALKNLGKEHQIDHLREYIRNRQYYLGNQYLRSVGDRFEYRNRTPGNEWRPQTTRNVITQTIDPIHAIISTANPLLNIQACFPDQEVMYHPKMKNIQETDYNYGELMSTGYNGEKTGEMFTEYIDKVWDSPYRKEHQDRAKVLKDSMFGGTAFRGYGIRQHPFRGTEVVVKNLQPQQVLLDPEGRDTITFADMRFVIIISYLDVMTIKRRYKSNENEYGQVRDDVITDPSTSGGFISRLFQSVSNQNSIKKTGTEIKEEWSLRRYPVYMLYYAGWMPDLLSIGEDHTEEIDRFPYPNGRLVTWINDMKIVEDQSIQTWGFTYPLVGFSPNPISHSAYGQSDVGKLVGPQDLINAFSNIIVANAMMNGHTQLLIEAGAMDPRTFSIRPGAIMTLAQDALRNGRIKQLFPGPLGQEVLQYMLNLEHWTKEEVGDSDGILRGKNPGSVTSGLHARTVQESAYNFQSFRIGLLDDSYELGTFKEVALTQQFVPLDNNYNKGYMGIRDGMDLAMRNLIYKIEKESKKDLPFSSGGQFELYFSMLRNGDITHKEFFELTKFHVSDEWKDKCDIAAQDAEPGVPPEIKYQERQAKEQLAAEAGALAGQLGNQEGMQPGEQSAGSGGQQPPADAMLDVVGGIDQV